MRTERSRNRRSYRRPVANDSSAELPANPVQELSIGDAAEISAKQTFNRPRWSEEMLWNGVAAQSGNFSARSITWKRGSLRRGSRSGSVFNRSSQGLCSRTAVSSDSSACVGRPHCV
jgi:hypothetical protein